MTETIRFSRSAIELYTRCPRQYKARYLDKHPDTSGPAAQVGIALHRAVELYAEYLFRTHQRSDKGTFQVICKEQFAALPPEEYLDATQVAERFVDSYVMLLDYVYGLEITLNVPLENGDMATGRLDRLDIVLGERAIIHDYKSGRYVPPASEMETDFQNLFYAWLVHRNFPEVLEIAVAQLFVRYGTIRNAVLDPAAIETMGEYAQTAVNRMKADTKFVATPGTHCQFCPVLIQCVESQVVPDPLHTNALVQWHAWATAMLKRVEGPLREIAKEKPIPYDSKFALGYWERRSTNYDTQQVLNICTGAGLDFTEFLQAKTSAVNKIAKRKDDWGRMAREAKRVHVSTIFGKRAIANADTNEEESNAESGD